MSKGLSKKNKKVLILQKINLNFYYKKDVIKYKYLYFLRVSVHIFSLYLLKELFLL